ncbi:MAG: NAD(P)/FAD-dependent oxidoreductase, partial [Myxococcota bacterium]
MNTWDAIVVGGGHNGLAAAASLARTGRKVVVVEARDHLGGLCAGEEFHPGYRHVGLHHDADTVRPWVIDALNLGAHGLALRDRPPLFLPAAPGETPGSGLLVAADPAAAKAELAIVGDADGYAAWRGFIDSVRPIVGALIDVPAPRLGQDAPLMPLLDQAFRLRRRGADALLELARVAVMSADDWVGESIGHERLRAGLILPALIGSWLGPRSPQSAGIVLLRELTAGRDVVGGPAKLVDALAAACRSLGVELRCSAAVQRIRVHRGVVQGVVLRDGEALDAPIVVSALDPRRTLLDLVPAGELPVPTEDEVRAIRVRATSAKLHLALSRAPQFTCREGAFERIAVVTSPNGIERAFDDAKHGRLPGDPPLAIRVPTVADPSLAPAGHHVLSAHVFGVPYAPAGGWAAGAREQLLDAVLKVLARVDPGIGGAVVAAELLVPPELEARYGVTGGHLMHAEHALDQLWVGRPSRTLSGHTTPIKGLYLGSAGTHPFGGPS